MSVTERVIAGNWIRCVSQKECVRVRMEEGNYLNGYKRKGLV